MGKKSRMGSLESKEILRFGSLKILLKEYLPLEYNAKLTNIRYEEIETLK